MKMCDFGQGIERNDIHEKSLVTEIFPLEKTPTTARKPPGHTNTLGYAPPNTTEYVPKHQQT